jgi:predicted MFS family arabinose efflux permease
MPRPPTTNPFQVRNFRFQWPADLLTSCAFEMEALILGWYMLVETGSVLMLTLFGALLFLGTLISPLFGVAGDRIGHRHVLCGMRAVYVLLSTTLMLIVFANQLSPLVVLVVTGLMGLVRPSDLGLRVVVAAGNMRADQLTAAMGVSRTTSDSARIAGALTGAGVFAIYGMGPAYVAVVTLYVLGLLLTLRITAAPRDATPEIVRIAFPHSSAWRDLREAIAHIWASPQLLAAMLIAMLVNFTAFPLSGGLLPYVVREIYQLDQRALGYLVASFAFGALLGSMFVSLRETARPARTMIAGAVVWYGFLLAFGQMQTLWGGILMLVLAGFAQSICVVALTVLLLRHSDARYRGRMMGLRTLAIYSLPLGLLVAGALIERFGFGATASLYTVVGLACTAAIALRWRADLLHSDGARSADP